MPLSFLFQKLDSSKAKQQSREHRLLQRRLQSAVIKEDFGDLLKFNQLRVSFINSTWQLLITCGMILCLGKEIRNTRRTLNKFSAQSNTEDQGALGKHCDDHSNLTKLDLIQI